jgi:hypothetical protein
MFQPDPKSVHFDLGVDRLADSEEVAEMHDPWTAMDHPLPHTHASHGLPEPDDQLEPWAKKLDLPGL